VRALTGIDDADLVGAPRVDELAPALGAALADARWWRTTRPSSATSWRASWRRRRPERASHTELLALAHPDAPDLRLGPRACVCSTRGTTRALPDALATARLLSHAAAGARAGAPRYEACARPSNAMRARSPWLALLRGDPLPAPDVAPEQYIEIPETRETPVPFDADAIAAALSTKRAGAGTSAATASAKGRSGWRASSCGCSTKAAACCWRAARASASRSRISPR
jgi:hypothetical protein